MNTPGPAVESHLCRDCHGPANGELNTGEWICSPCWNASVYRRRAERKAQLAAMPRCEVQGCKARGTWTVCHVALLCGRHKKMMNRVHERNMASAGGMGLFMTVTYSREQVIQMASNRSV